MGFDHGQTMVSNAFEKWPETMLWAWSIQSDNHGQPWLAVVPLFKSMINHGQIFHVWQWSTRVKFSIFDLGQPYGWRCFLLSMSVKQGIDILLLLLSLFLLLRLLLLKMLSPVTSNKKTTVATGHKLGALVAHRPLQHLWSSLGPKYES